MPYNKQAKSMLDYNISILPRLQKLCAPLNIIGISNFAYGKITKDQKFFRIGTHERYTDLFFEKDTYNQNHAYRGLVTHETFGKNPEFRSYVWGADRKVNHFEDMRVAVGMWNGITFYQTTPEYIETWAVGGTLEDNQLLNFYMNNRDLLFKFIAYFKEAGKDIIDLSDGHKAIDIAFHSPRPDLENNNQKITKFLKTVMKENPSLVGNHGEFVLSSREFDCLYYKSKGLTAKEISRVFSISPRTVETYLSSMKKKSGFKSINQLICLSKDTGVL